MQKIFIWNLVNGQKQYAFIWIILNMHSLCVSFRMKAFQFCQFHSWSSDLPEPGRRIVHWRGNVCYVALGSTFQFCRGLPAYVFALCHSQFCACVIQHSLPLRSGGSIVVDANTLICVVILLNTDTQWWWLFPNLKLLCSLASCKVIYFHPIINKLNNIEECIQ